jgi:methionyl-tRNA synthetase
LPDYLPTRGHLLLKNKKLSKSRNWYISIEDFTQRFETDYLRFYLASITPYSQDDVNFDWDTFRDKINNELIANIGNFINRTLTLIQNKFASSVPRISKLENYDNEAIDRIHAIGTEVGTKIESNHLNRALMDILAFSSFLNSYFQQKKPWSSSSVDTTLYISVNAVRTLAIILAPFLPNSSERIWCQLNLGDSVHKQEWSSSGDLQVGPGHVIGSIVPLFRKIDRDTIEKLQIEMTGK